MGVLAGGELSGTPVALVSSKESLLLQAIVLVFAPEAGAATTTVRVDAIEAALTSASGQLISTISMQIGLNATGLSGGAVDVTTFESTPAQPSRGGSAESYTSAHLESMINIVIAVGAAVAFVLLLLVAGLVYYY